MEETIAKKVFTFEVVAFESGAANSHNPEQEKLVMGSQCVNKHP